MNTMRLTDFDTLTFDCYGTLIDWETGIFDALRPWLERAGVPAGRAEITAAFGAEEAAQQVATPGMLYPELLATVMLRLGRRWKLPVGDAEAAAFGASIGDWPAFPDSAAALAYLKGHCRLVILSNVDRESFARSNATLGVGFDAVFTAQDIGSYKPDARNFDYLIDRLAARGIDKGRILHTAQSIHHDHVPATRAGLATNWIDRRGAAIGVGELAPAAAEARIDFHFPDMTSFAAAHRAETAG